MTPLLLGTGRSALSLGTPKAPMLLRSLSGGGGDPKALLWNPPVGTGSRSGHNLQFGNLFNGQIDWGATAADARYGTGLIRWQSVYWRSESYRDQGWQSMYHGAVTDLRRDAGDASVMTFLCEWNNYAPETGQAFVLGGSNPGDDGWVDPAKTSLSWDGFAIPLRQKLTVLGSAKEGSKLRVRIRFPGQALPATVLSAPALVAYHWNFYLNSARAVRSPMDWAASVFRHWCVDLGMWGLWGGEQGIPTWYSDYQKVLTFGTSLIEEIKRQEYEWRGSAFVGVDPRKLAQAFENERNDDPDLDAESEAWHRDANYPLLRSAMPEATICQGSSNFKAPYDIGRMLPLPDDGLNKCLEFHTYPGVAGFDPWDGAQVAAMRGYVLGQAAELGYDMACCGEFGVYPTGPNGDRDDPGRGVPLGRMLTGMQGGGIPLMAWSMVGDGYWSAYPDERGVLGFFPAFRDACSRVGDTAL